MGPIDWIAVVLAGNCAVALGLVWYGPLFRTGEQLLPGRGSARAAPRRSWALVLGVMLIAALMMGHNFARVGAAVLAAKPWLYWMMSGGLAIAFVIPAVWLGALRHGTNRRLAAIDCGFWLAAYLTMGTVFWALR